MTQTNINKNLKTVKVTYLKNVFGLWICHSLGLELHTYPIRISSRKIIPDCYNRSIGVPQEHYDF